jgi:DNA-binding NarL/FixJ family response regulator
MIRILLVDDIPATLERERDSIRRAMQAGAREFLIKPFSGDEVPSSIRRVHQLEQRQGPVLAKQAAAGHPRYHRVMSGPAATTRV